MKFLYKTKKSSTIVLIVYLVFFALLIVFFRGKTTDIVKVDSNQVEFNMSDNFGTYKSYSYDIKYTYNDLHVDEIVGTYSNNKSLFDYNGIKYYYEDSLYQIEGNTYFLTNINYDITKILNINSLIEKCIESSSLTYEDNTIEKNYLLNKKDFNSYYYSDNNEVEGFISLTTRESSNKINYILIDLSSLGLDLNKIEVSYTNINNISNLFFNKQNYIYKE